MRHKVAIAVVTLLLLLLPLSAGAQSLGDAARRARAQKKSAGTAKVFTDDNLPKNATINVGGATATAPETKPTKPADAAAGEQGEATDADTPADPAEVKKKAEADYRDKVKAQKEEITRLERELDVAQRENRLRAAQFYGDAGARLRDEKKFAEDDRKYQAEIENKQKALSDARQKLDQLRDDIRKAGLSVPE